MQFTMKYNEEGNVRPLYEAIKDDGSGRYILKILRAQHWGSREEIGYFETQAAAARGNGRMETRETYFGFLYRRRQLLAAIRDQRPWAWREYTPAG